MEEKVLCNHSHYDYQTPNTIAGAIFNGNQGLSIFSPDLIDRELKLFLMNRGNVGDQGNTTLREDDIGLPESFKRDAQSDRSETIFRYVIEKVGLFLDTIR